MRPALIALLALAAGAAPARAQDGHTFRRTFTFLRDDILIDVVADGSGSLQIVRGGRGDVTVAARAHGALLSTAAPDRPEDPLRLIALGPGSADWIVTIPAHVRVQVRAPDSGHVVPAAGEAPVWRWRAPRRPVHRTARHDRERERHDEPSFAFAEPEAPDTIAIDGLADPGCGLGGLRDVPYRGVRHLGSPARPRTLPVILSEFCRHSEPDDSAVQVGG